MPSVVTAGAAIALAEDNADQRWAIARLLQQLGYRVVCAVANGAELLHFLTTNDADVALVDLDMPIVDGLEAAEELSRRDVPVIMISGLPDTEHLVLEKEPIIARLTKPVTAQTLQDSIETALAASPERRQSPPI